MNEEPDATPAEEPPASTPGHTEEAHDRSLEREIPELMVECTQCRQQRTSSDVIDTVCSACRSKAEPAGIIASVGWPEVRQRRMMMLLASDSTQLLDRGSEVSDRFAAWREELRNITQLPSPFDAWLELDRLQSERPQE